MDFLSNLWHTFTYVQISNTWDKQFENKGIEVLGKSGLSGHTGPIKIYQNDANDLFSALKIRKQRD